MTSWDAAQQAIIELPAEASGVVIGAPGTGKTDALVARVGALVASGVEPDSVLVLTPTRVTATALRDRLAVTVGTATSGPMARSVASFAFQVVRAAAVHTGGEPPQLLTGADEDQIIHDLLRGDEEDEADAAAGPARWPEWLGSGIRSTKAFRAEVRAFLAECAALGLTSDRVRVLGQEHEQPVWRAMSSFQEEYAQVMADMRGAHRDPAALVREAAELLRAGHGADGALGPFAGLRVVMIDDAQELTVGGVELTEALRSRGVAAVAFGDPDVGSGTFRGASPANFARLAASLGAVHVLPTVHRGTSAQGELVRRITERIGAAGLVAHRTAPAQGHAPDDSVRALAARSASEQYDAIARMLRERHVIDGVPWSECAVIAHDTRQVAALEAELAAREVPTRAASSGRALGSLRPVRDILHIVSLAVREEVPAGAPGDRDWSQEDIDEALLGTFGGFDPVALRRLRTGLRHAELSAGGERAGRELLASALRHPLEFEALDTRDARRAARLARNLQQVREADVRGATAHELLWIVWDQSGLARTWAAAARGGGPQADQAGRDLDALVTLFQTAKRFVERDDAGDSMTFVRHVLESDVADDAFSAPVARSAVRVLTPAAALGTEFDTVIVAGVQDRVWPNLRLRGGLLETWRLADAASGGAGGPTGSGVPGDDVLDRRRAAMHDELRLFARAVSRARERLIVTAVDDDDLGASVFFELLPTPGRGGRALEHPLSLRGITAEHRRALTDPAAPSSAATTASAQLALLARAGVPGADPAQWYGVAAPTSTTPLRDIRREDIRVSPSRIHSLEECELNWVIADLGGDSRMTAAGLGTILHGALETAATDEQALWDAVEKRWHELDFDAPWRERAEKTRARDLVRRLHVYLAAFEAAGGRLVGAEPHFEVALELSGGPVAPIDGETPHRVVLSGYIDRVEVNRSDEVVIVDLKTGKREPQSDTAVRDNPQLAAYQLAFERGQIEGTDGLAPGGAKLLVLVPTATRKDYAEPHQPPFDDDARQAFLERVDRAAHTMAGIDFLAPYEEHCRKDHSYGLCRIHTVKAVSAP